MHSVTRIETAPTQPVIREFKRREFLPMIGDLLWEIDAGMVRTLTSCEEGKLITLGLWGVGDIVGHPLAGIEPYQVECLTKVQAHRLPTIGCSDLNRVMWSHIRQSQTLLMIRHGLMPERLQQFLLWLAEKFGTRGEEGCYIPHQLTHQDIAEIIGTSRVTVTRLIGDLERAGFVHWSKRKCLLQSALSSGPSSIITHTES